MPLLSLPVTELPSHIFDPVIQQCVDRLLCIMAYRERIGDKIYITTDFTTHSKTSDIHKNAIMNEEGFRVQADIQLNPASAKWEGYTFHHTASQRIDLRALNENAPIYIDPHNRVRIVELQSPASISMNCTLTLMSKELAYQTPTQLFNRYGTGEVVEYQDIFFDYPVPRPMLELIFHFWGIDRLKGKPAGVSFYDYLQYHTETVRGKRDGWQIVMNRHRTSDTDDREVVVPVYRISAYTTVEYSNDRPEPIQANRATVGYNISFGMSVQFSIPTVLIMQYPVVFNNQILSEAYIPREITTPRNNIRASSHYNHMRNYTHEHMPHLTSPIQSPVYDDWIPPTQTKLKDSRMMPYWIIAATIDETEDGRIADTTTLCIGDDFDNNYSIKQCVKDIMKLQGAGTIDYDCIYGVQLYKDDKLLTPHVDFTWDNDTLSVIFTPANTFSQYHLVLSNSTNLNHIAKKYYPLIASHFYCMPEIIKEQVRKDKAWIGVDKPLHPGGHRYPPSIDSDGNILDDFNNPYDHISPPAGAGGGGSSDDTSKEHKPNRIHGNIIYAKSPNRTKK